MYILLLISMILIFNRTLINYLYYKTRLSTNIGEIKENYYIVKNYNKII